MGFVLSLYVFTLVVNFWENSESIGIRIIGAIRIIV